MASWLNIEKIYEYCPTRLLVTDDGYRPLNGPIAQGNWDFHVAGQAVDLANNSAPDMRDAALWWHQFAPYLTELIHTTPYPTDNGFYVKNGVVRPEGFYGAAVERAHENHVHVAMTDEQAITLLKKLQAKYGPPGKPQPVAPVPELTPQQKAYNAAFQTGFNVAFDAGYTAGYLSATTKK